MEYAEDIMVTNVVTLAKNSNISDAMDKILQNKISGIPVVDDNQKCIGVVSLYDILQSGYVQSLDFSIISKNHEIEDSIMPLFSSLLSVETKKRSVREVMKPIVIHAQKNTTIKELASMMYNAKIHRVIILEDDQVVGIVTSMDMLKYIYH